jgi:nitroreductase
MSDLLKLIEKRCSARIPFNRSRPVARADLLQVLEAARWSPTAHNMQNFEVVIVDDQELLDKIGTIEVQPSKVFLRENFQLLSFSEDELRQRKIGLLAHILPEWMRDDAAMENANSAMPLHCVMPGPGRLGERVCHLVDGDAHPSRSQLRSDVLRLGVGGSSHGQR